MPDKMKVFRDKIADAITEGGNECLSSVYMIGILEAAKFHILYEDKR